MPRTGRPWLRLALGLGIPLVAAGLALGAGVMGGCGEDVGVCGNGVVESPEDCDCGTNPARLPGSCYDVNGAEYSGCSTTCHLKNVQFTQIMVTWSVNGPAATGGGTFDTCSDVGATWVNVKVEGPDGVLADEQVSCGLYQTTFQEDPRGALYPAGDYTVTLGIETASGSPLAPESTTTFPLVQRIQNQVWLDFPLESFYAYDTFTGQFGYRLFWGTQTAGCTTAATPVVETSLALLEDGLPIAGFPLDGACEESTKFIADIPAGDYQFRVVGFDSEDGTAYCDVVDVKVGSGIQPAYQLVIPAALDASACD